MPSCTLASACGLFSAFSVRFAWKESLFTSDASTVLNCPRLQNAILVITITFSPCN